MVTAMSDLDSLKQMVSFGQPGEERNFNLTSDIKLLMIRRRGKMIASYLYRSGQWGTTYGVYGSGDIPVKPNAKAHHTMITRPSDNSNLVSDILLLA